MSRPAIPSWLICVHQIACLVKWSMSNFMDHSRVKAFKDGIHAKPWITSNELATYSLQLPIVNYALSCSSIYQGHTWNHEPLES
ncbi:hypothetical protein GOP47_0020571 [Adiantum capillus-veneris]|uniref:Uncharacterized protein n=1 Tax=Adiantum capillus-veneris TaxID=13818 RepID=A0A9D4UBB2_ADICA|nr:hypothetical protein GOP47_0020571 [Adiantum capillus-veneris]